MPPRRQLSTPGAWPNPGLTERRCTHARSGETSASELFRRPTAARAVPRHWQSHRATGPQSHRATGPQGAPRLGTPSLHQQTRRSFPAHLHKARANDHLGHHAETSADECGPRKRQRIDHWQPSSPGGASPKERSSQTSLDSGSLPRPYSVMWAPSALNEAPVVQNPLYRRVSLLCCLQRRQETRLAPGRRALRSRGPMHEPRQRP